MIPTAFDYTAPATLDEALAALQEGGDEAKIIAGGQSLVPVLRLRMADPAVLIDLRKIGELREITQDGDGVRIGAMATHHAVLSHPLVREHLPLLAETEGTVADPQVRHRGTLGGALVHADPAGDLSAVALALDADFEIVGPGGRRTVPASEFFVDYFATAVQEDEILSSIRFPSYAGWTARYEKFQRVAQSWSVVAVACAVRTGGAGIEEARIALTNMGATPVRATSVEAALAGGPATPEAVTAAAAHAADGTNPVDDTSASAEYRQHLARVLTARAIRACLP